MSAHTFLTCDTVTDGARCPGKTAVYHTCIVAFARELAGSQGWGKRSVPRTGEVEDLCPDCAPRKAPQTRHIPGRNCPPGAACHILGHDQVGHRVTNILADTALSLEQAIALTNTELVRVDGLGPRGIERLRSRLNDRETQ